MITPITEIRVQKASAFLQELYERAKSDEIRSQYNESAPPHDQEELFGFQRGDGVGIFSVLQILFEMERLKYNEKIFVTWIEILLSGDWASRSEIAEAFESYRTALNELEIEERG